MGCSIVVKKFRNHVYISDFFFFRNEKMNFVLRKSRNISNLLGNNWVLAVKKKNRFCRFIPTGRGAWKDGRVRGAEGEGGSMRAVLKQRTLTFEGVPCSSNRGARGLVGSQNFEEKPDWSPTKKTLHY